jgi:hypothetical protein
MDYVSVVPTPVKMAKKQMWIVEAIPVAAAPTAAVARILAIVLATNVKMECAHHARTVSVTATSWE